MRIAVSADERVGIADVLIAALKRRGHAVSAHGALARADRALCGEAPDGSRGDADRALCGEAPDGSRGDADRALCGEAPDGSRGDADRALCGEAPGGLRGDADRALCGEAPDGGQRETDEREDWAWASEAAAREVAEDRADQAVVCCWTGTGASIAANKVAGVRAALCGDAATAAGARRWNDANVLALSLRGTSAAELEEILDAWFATAVSIEAGDRESIAHLSEIESRARKGI